MKKIDTPIVHNNYLDESYSLAVLAVPEERLEHVVKLAESIGLEAIVAPSKAKKIFDLGFKKDSIPKIVRLDEADAEGEKEKLLLSFRYEPYAAVGNVSDYHGQQRGYRCVMDWQELERDLEDKRNVNEKILQFVGQVPRKKNLLVNDVFEFYSQEIGKQTIRFKVDRLVFTKKLLELKVQKRWVAFAGIDFIVYRPGQEEQAADMLVSMFRQDYDYKETDFRHLPIELSEAIYQSVKKRSKKT